MKLGSEESNMTIMAHRDSLFSFSLFSLYLVGLYIFQILSMSSGGRTVICVIRIIGVFFV
jgi:hypothetical protein